jgi:hypothetical protein
MTQFLTTLTTTSGFRHIGRVELSTRESNPAAKMYIACGFIPEGRFERRIRMHPTLPPYPTPLKFEADIPMAWHSPSFVPATLTLASKL